MNPTQKTTIRTASAKDAPAIVHLILALAEAEGEISPLTAQYVCDYLSSPASEVLLAETQGMVVGLLSYSLRPDLYHAAPCCLVESLVVLDEQRGHGIGRQLMEALLTRARQRGCAEVAVGVMPENLRARQFYRLHGLVEEALLLETHLVKA